MKRLSLICLMAALGAVTFMAKAEGEINISPAPGEVTSLSEFHLTFNGEWALGSQRTARFSLTGPEGVEIPKLMSYSLGADGYMVYLENPDDEDSAGVLSAPGEYVLTVPAGKFEIAGKDVPETKFHYTIVSGAQSNPFPAFTVSPEAGNYDTLTSFTLTIDTTEAVTAYASKIFIIGSTDSYGTKAEVSGNTVTVTPVDSYGADVTITQAGTYSLYVKTGGIKAGDVGNSEEIIVTYTVGTVPTGTWNGSYSATPRDGSSVKELKEIKITLGDCTTVSVSDTAGPSDFPKLYNAANDNVVSTCTVFPSGNVLDISLANTMTQGGEYYLLVPKTFFRPDGRESEIDLKLNYTIKGEETAFEYTYTLNPSESAKIRPETNITIEFEAEGLTQVEINEFAWGTSAPYFTNDFEAYNPTIQVITESETRFVLSHNWPFEKSGEYTLVIPPEYFTLTNSEGKSVKNEEITAKYKVDMLSSVIGNLEAERTPVSVYTAQGVLILRNATPARIASLPAGLYIINGKKTLKK